MEITNSTNDLATQLAATLQGRDDLRLSQLKNVASLAAAQRSAMEAEQKRLIEKYGAESPQASAAQNRIAMLDQESATLNDSITRAALPVPALDPESFVVYGRILDAAGIGVGGAKITANNAAGSALSSSTSKAQGIFELRIPSRSIRRKTGKGAAQPQDASPTTIQLVATGKNIQRAYAFPETMRWIAAGLAYREITLPAKTV
jgi:hypothetical protein